LRLSKKAIFRKSFISARCFSIVLVRVAIF
jgi:hypothetical protein